MAASTATAAAAADADASLRAAIEKAGVASGGGAGNGTLPQLLRRTARSAPALFSPAHAGRSLTLACPSFVDTALDRHALDGEGVQGRSMRVVIGRPPAPEAVARAISDAATRGRPRVLIGPARRTWPGGSAAWPRACTRA